MMQQLEIREEMAAVRRRGLVNADVLAERVEKLSDWREHVRAHPLPIAMAVGALAYWLVPSRSRTGTGTASVLPDSRSRTGAVMPSANASSSEDSKRAAAGSKAAGLGGISGAAMGFVGSLIGNAVRNYVSEQVHTLIASRGNHGTSQQRQTPLSRF